MIAVVESPMGYHVVYWTGRVGLSVRVKTYCGQTLDAAKGVIQMPDRIVTEENPQLLGTKLKVCQTCRGNCR